MFLFQIHNLFLMLRIKVLNKIFESDLIFKIFLINELKRKEFMNQYKFSGAFVEEITKRRPLNIRKYRNFRLKKS